MSVDTQVTRVVLVDDAAESRNTLRKALSFDPHIEVVGEADSGEEAVRQVEALRPDVVLMDIRMPGDGGIAATRSIAGRFPETRVVALTAHEDPDSIREMLTAGATGYVVKGASVDEVAAAVRMASDGQSLLDERVVPFAMEDLRRLLRGERQRRVEAERVATMREEFVHVLAHELRSPLTVMAGALRFLEKRTPRGDVADLITSALQRADHLEHLIEGLELIGEDGRVGAANPADAVAQASARLDAVPALVEVSGEPWPDIPPRHLGRIVYELLDNAIRHGRPPVEVRTLREDGEATITVSDAGDFEPSEDLLAAFTQRDMSTTREKGGMGLGLFIASRLTEASGGRLALRREAGRTVAEARFVLRPR